MRKKKKTVTCFTVLHDLLLAAASFSFGICRWMRTFHITWSNLHRVHLRTSSSFVKNGLNPFEHEEKREGGEDWKAPLFFWVWPQPWMHLSAQHDIINSFTVDRCCYHYNLPAFRLQLLYSTSRKCVALRAVEFFLKTFFYKIFRYLLQTYKGTYVPCAFVPARRLCTALLPNRIFTRRPPFDPLHPTSTMN